MSEIPENLSYTKEHEWASLEEDGNVKVGITDHAQDALSDVVFVELPGLGKQERIDPTFIASVFTGALASFGLETAKKRGDGTYKADEEKKKAEALGAEGGVPYTIIRVETPIKLVPDKPRIDPITNKPVDPQTGKLT